MKVCPVCKATSFKDMDVCFGCMHRFGEPEESDFERGDDVSVFPAEPSVRESGHVPDTASDGGALSRSPGVSSVLSRPDAEGMEAKAPAPRGLGLSADAGSGAVSASAAEDPVVLPVTGGGFDLVISIRPA